jgi:antitoxin (DNA-binding transcriptional repressor) of toxin-antitoxin stability system
VDEFFLGWGMRTCRLHNRVCPTRHSLGGVFINTRTFTELQKHASKLFSEVEMGSTLLVLRHGKPIAKISPVSSERTPSWKRPGLRLTAKGSSLSEVTYVRVV